MPATVLKWGYSPGSMIQLETAPSTGLIRRHILISLTFAPSVRRGHEPEAESEDRNEDQHPEASVKSGRFGPKKGWKPSAGDAHAVDQQTAEEHLHGIEEDRIDPARPPKTEIAE